MREIDDDDEPAQLDVNIDGDEDQPVDRASADSRRGRSISTTRWILDDFDLRRCCPRWTMTSLDDDS